MYFFNIGDTLIARDFHSLSLNRNLVISYEVVVVGECLYMAIQNLLQSCKPWERLALKEFLSLGVLAGAEPVPGGRLVSSTCRAGCRVGPACL